MKPALIASVFLSVFMLWFNDQLLPRANHELAALQIAIFAGSRRSRSRRR